MLLTQILQPKGIVAPIQSTDKEEAITELIDVLANSNQLSNRDEVLDAVLMREQTRSTGIGSGIAIPHGKCKGVSELVMAIGIAVEPIEFDSIDGKPVNIIVLLVSPTGQTGPHIQALAKISRLMLDEDFRAKLESSTSPEAVYALIEEKESE